MSKRHATSTQARPDHMTTMISDCQKASVGVQSWASPVWVKAASEMGAEISSFLACRLREDLKTQDEILRCWDPIEFRAIQGQYLKTAFDQYCAETGKLMQLHQAALATLTGRRTSG